MPRWKDKYPTYLEIRRSPEFKIPCKSCGARSRHWCVTNTGNLVFGFHKVRSYMAGVGPEGMYSKKTKELANE